MMRSVDELTPTSGTRVRGTRLQPDCWLASLLLLLCACRATPTHRDVDRLARTEPQQVNAGHERAAPGRWRLAAPSELENVALHLSHILIRHRESEPSAAPFNLGDWRPLDTPPARTRAQAMLIASNIAADARTNPQQFPALALRHSDDMVTRDSGGSLGGVRASDLIPWPSILDAVQATAPGHVGPVVETTFGFHVILRKAPPPPTEITGRRLVIGYDSASQLERMRRPGRQRFSRSRTEALKLISTLRYRAAASPDTFGALILEHSEHKDALQGGDIGTWSSREPSRLSRELEVLAELSEGQVSTVLDGQMGFSVVQRLAPKPRPDYAVQGVRLAFDPTLPPEHLASKAARFRLAEMIIANAERDDKELQKAQELFCCSGVQHWMQGRGLFEIEQIVHGLRVNELSKAPIEYSDSYVVVRRVEPTALPPPAAASYELPNPVRPDLFYALRSRPADVVATVLNDIASDMKSSLREPIFSKFNNVHQRLVNDLLAEQDAQLRAELLRAGDLRIEGVLKTAINDYHRIRDRHFESLLLGSRTDASR